MMHSARCLTLPDQLTSCAPRVCTPSPGGDLPPPPHQSLLCATHEDKDTAPSASVLQRYPVLGPRDLRQRHTGDVGVQLDGGTFVHLSTQQRRGEVRSPLLADRTRV